MIEIVKFEKSKQGITIGYRENSAVVYATVSNNLTDSEAKQKGYEQAYKALKYEANQKEPSINGSKMGAIETFSPKTPRVADVQIKGDNYISFEDETARKSVNYLITAIDQYGNVFSESTDSETVENKNYIHTITKTLGDITALFNINVKGYTVPTPSETELLHQDVDSLAKTTAVILEDTTAVAETTAVLVEDSAATASTLATTLLEIENLKVEVATLKGA